MTYLAINPALSASALSIDGAAAIVRRAVSGSFTTKASLDMALLAAALLQKHARDIEAQIISLRQEAQCASPQALPSDGNGGKEPSQVIPFRFTKMSLKPGSTRSASFATATGRPDRVSPLASGGSQVRSTPKPESF